MRKQPQFRRRSKRLNARFKVGELAVAVATAVTDAAAVRELAPPRPQRQPTTTTTTEAAADDDGSVGVVVVALRGRPSGQMRRGPQEAAWIVAGFRRRTAPCAWDVGGRMARPPICGGVRSSPEGLF